MRFYFKKLKPVKRLSVIKNFVLNLQTYGLL